MTPGYTAGAVYNYDPQLSHLDGQDENDFYAVSHAHGHVIGFSMPFFPGTSQHDAIEAVMLQLPHDAEILWTADKGTCFEMQLESRKLGRALADPAIGGSNGDVFVDFDSLDPAAPYSNDFPRYSATSVRNTDLVLANFSTAHDGPDC